MDDQNITQDLVPDSTVIDLDVDSVKSGGGRVAPEPLDKPEPNRKPESIRDSLEAEAKKIAAKPDTDEEGEEGDDNGDKPEVAKKDEAKAAKPEARDPKESVPPTDGNEPEAKTQKPSEGRKIIEAPARLLPRAKELWNNVPHPVREEWVRLDEERDAEIAQYREAKVFRDELKDFEDLAKKNNVPFKDALTNYVDIERKFSEDPATGFRQLCQNLGLTPPQAIGHILRSANVTPQQLMEHLQREPQAYTGLAPQRQAAQQPQPQQRAPDPEVMALKQEVESMRAERVANDVIRPFATEYPEYFENEDAIAKVLKSGIIEQIHGNGLGPRDKLEAALFMVAPHVKRSNGQVDYSEVSVPSAANTQTPAVDLRGGKSVRSSPGEVTEMVEPDRKLSMREMLEEEARKIGRKAS